MFCVLFAGFLTKVAQGVGFYHDFLPQGLVFCTFLVPGVGNSPFQKFPQGFAWGVVMLGID